MEEQREGGQRQNKTKCEEAGNQRTKSARRHLIHTSRILIYVPDRPDTVSIKQIKVTQNGLVVFSLSRSCTSLSLLDDDTKNL